MNVKKIYFVGIKGVGMTPLAILAKEGKIEVAGSDIEEEFITDVSLKKADIHPLVGFNPKNIEEFVKDTVKHEVLVITTSAHGGFENPETKYARDNGFTVITQGQAVGMFMEGKVLGRDNLKGISIAGSHGKTTVTSLFATAFTFLGFDPSYVAGTSEIFPIGLPGHFGQGEYFIAEADEYVSEPQYDLQAKFLYQNPSIAVFNNIDFDHPDFYKDIDSVESSFFQFAKKIQKNGMLVINGDSDRLVKLAKQLKDIRILSFGSSSRNDYYISSFKELGMKSFFTVEKKDVSLGDFSLSVPGFHNAKNSLPAIAVLIELGVSVDKIKKVLPGFKGTKRRLEIVGETADKNILIDDYAHHPAEIKTSLSAIKNAFPGKKIVCVFQPHTYSRTMSLLSDFVSSFFDAHFLILLPIYASLRENLDTKAADGRLFSEIKKIRRDVVFLKDQDGVIEYINRSFLGSDFVIVTMGAGDVYKIMEQLKINK